jgi:glycerophosphoryl diester phosphodiesterase
VRLIAHRGASAYAPANTPEAVTAAATHGATDVEVDVHQTADGYLVVTHDAVHGHRFISEMTLDEFSVVGGDHGREPVAVDHILTAAAEADLGVYLDVKQLLPGGVERLARSIDAAGLRERTVFASFRSDLALEAKRIAGLTTSVLFHDPGLDLHSLVACTGCDFVHPCFDVFADPLVHVTPVWLERARRTGAGIIAWNTTTAEMADALIELGVDGICADDPALLVDALARRATPPPRG